MNVDDNPDTSAKCGVMTIPTLILYKDGKEMDRLASGLVPKDRLVEFAEKVL